MKKYELTEDDMYRIVEKTLNDLFRALAFKDVRLDIGQATLPITAEIRLPIDGNELKFHLQLLPRVDVRVSHLAETPEEIQQAARRIGFRNNGRGKIHEETIQDSNSNIIAVAK